MENKDKEFKILLVEDEPMECAAIGKYIDTCDGARLVGVTNNIDKALEIVAENSPDAIILDLELHKGFGNGLIFMEKLNELSINYRPYLLITTNNSSHVTYDHTRELGADFILGKYQEDYSAEGVVDFLMSMKNTIMYKKSKQNVEFRAMNKEDKEAEKRRLLKKLNNELDLVGVSPKAVGRHYLLDGIIMAVEKGYVPNLCNLLAASYKKSVSSVERAMSNAVLSAWKRSSPEELQRHYTAKVRPERGSPTLSEFIYYYAEKLKD